MLTDTDISWRISADKWILYLNIVSYHVHLHCRSHARTRPRPLLHRPPPLPRSNTPTTATPTPAAPPPPLLLSNPPSTATRSAPAAPPTHERPSQTAGWQCATMGAGCDNEGQGASRFGMPILAMCCHLRQSKYHMICFHMPQFKLSTLPVPCL